jgi:hypothetical protein
LSNIAACSTSTTPDSLSPATVRRQRIASEPRGARLRRLNWLRKIVRFRAYLGQSGQVFGKNPLCALCPNLVPLRGNGRRLKAKSPPVTLTQTMSDYRQPLLPCSPALIGHFPLDDLSFGQCDAGMTDSLDIRAAPGCTVFIFTRLAQTGRPSRSYSLARCSGGAWPSSGRRAGAFGSRPHARKSTAGPSPGETNRRYVVRWGT